ncbi:MAG: hypothetical protein KatS3mg115_1895 [Candidatus Poribacteria bacterium]|nr:MAG: hypothetical protein KatS3mg115_1895 [Candidatus Poribacteria bacterium]
MARAAPTRRTVIRLYLYPLWLRLWHWSNAVLFLVLILTGISMHYADLTSPWVPFRVARVLHNLAGILLALLYLGFLIGNAVSGNWRYYVPPCRGLFRGVRKQLHYYLVGIFRGEPHPFHPSERSKFNPLQQVAYLVVMYVLMPLLVGTGVLLLFPEWAPERVLGWGGVWPMAVAHSGVAFLLTLFLVAHLYLATTGERVAENFCAMVRGWHEVAAAEEADDGKDALLDPKALEPSDR